MNATLNAQYKQFVGMNLGPSQRPLHILAWMLMLEAAEIGNEVKRIKTKDENELTDYRREKILEELGDAFYYFTAITNHLGFDLEDVVEFNMNKLEERNGTRRPILDNGGYSPVPDMPSTYDI